MTNAQINTEINKTEEMMNLLMDCIKEAGIKTKEGMQYYKEYLEVSAYFIKLNQVKPNHNFTIA